MKRIVYSIVAVLSSACITLAQQAPDSVSIRVIATFDYPGIGNSTFPQKINDQRDIVGTYNDSNGVGRGFVRFSNGNFSAPIVDPNDTCNSTEGRGINNSRLVCGDYGVGDCTISDGFFLTHNSFSQFDVPGATTTLVLGVNNTGDFAGEFTDTTGLGLGFVSIGGMISSFSVPEAIFTFAYQINSSNQTAGQYLDGSLIFHGFWREANGTLHFPVDAPGSTQTLLFGNNDSNWMVGRYVDSAGTAHGLFFVAPNRFFTFDYPGAIFTSLNGINAQGFICGRYADSSGTHGFMAQVRGVPPASEAGTEIKAYHSPLFVTPVSAQF